MLLFYDPDKLMNNKLFYHFYIPDSPSNWELLLYEQLDCIESSELHHECKLEICVSSNESNFNKLKNCINFYPVLNLKISWFDTSNEKNTDHHEGNTLSKLYDECSFYENVGYIHSKSVTSITKYTNKWRKALEHAVIEKYQDNLKALNNNHDVSGILWSETDIARYFCGNFWWAKSSYIQTLPKPTENWNGYNGDFWESRCRYEAWIGIKNPRVNEIYSSNISLGISMYYHDFDIKRTSTLKFDTKLSYF